MVRKASDSPNSSISKIEKELKNLKQVATAQDVNARRIVSETNNEDIDNKTRHEIAKLITWLYFGVLLLIVVGIPAYNLIAQATTNSDTYRLNILDILQGYQSVVGTLVGFVIAYYFKERS